MPVSFPRGTAARSALCMAAFLAGARAAAVTADFSVPAGYPLDHSKINLYTTALPSTRAYERDIPWLGKLGVESLRLEFFWGMEQTLSHSVSGTREKPAYDWALLDHWQELANAQGAQVQWGYDYTPRFLGDGSGDAFKRPPPEEAWARIVGDVAAHLKGKAVIRQEVWNEPDFDWFFLGGAQDYFRIYESTARAVRAADPDASVGGPAVSQTGWYVGFLSYVRDRDLPLDFFSFHNYGDQAAAWAGQASALLAGDARFDRTELSLGEYNVYHAWPAGAAQDRFTGAGDMLNAFLDLMDLPDLANVYWAQFMDPCDCGGTERLGLLDLEGHRKAAYNAFRLWALQPSDRTQALSDASTLRVAAASDSRRAGLLVLNRGSADQDVSVRIRNLPFARGTMRVYRIDAAHNSRGDGANEDLAPSESAGVATAGEWSWNGRVPAKATLAFLADAEGQAGPEALPAARILRVNRWYPRRGKTPAYALFERRAWTARLGAMGDTEADEQVGVTAEGLPPALEFRVRGTGLVLAGAGSLIGMRIDFTTSQGYAKGVLFHGRLQGIDLFDPAAAPAIAYGTQRKPDQVVDAGDLSRFTVELARYAPPGWTGRAQIHFQLRHAGPQARVAFEIRTAQATGLRRGARGPRTSKPAADKRFRIDGARRAGPGPVFTRP